VAKAKRKLKRSASVPHALFRPVAVEGLTHRSGERPPLIPAWSLSGLEAKQRKAKRRAAPQVERAEKILRELYPEGVPEYVTITMASGDVTIATDKRGEPKISYHSVRLALPHLRRSSR
jgi:hypothetical protein